jgi:cytochrome c-type biogenesis protein CcmH
MMAFIVLALAMLALALAFPLWPMLRHQAAPLSADGSDRKRRKALQDALDAGVITTEEFEVKLGNRPDANVRVPTDRGSPRSVLLACAAVAVLLPAGAFVLYRLYGEPRALDPAALASPASAMHETTEAGGEPVDMDQAVAGLVAKLEANPDNADGWALLGRAYQSMGRFADSRDALKHAFDLKPDNHDLTVEYAQALALSGEGRRIAGESRALIEKVHAADPDHQRALWLIGISDYQAGNYDAAIVAWNRLLPALPADSDIATSVRTQIAEAQKLGGKGSAIAASTGPSPAGATESTTAPLNSAGPRLTVRVSLDASLKDRLDPSATVFVFARAENGPPMPLAIQRLSASALPTTVTLDDSMGMLPTMKLSMFPKVVLGARISRSGNAQAQTGDLQVLSSGIEVTRTEPVDLVIDSVVP